MLNLRNSLVALAGVLALIGVIAVVTPGTTQGKDDPGGPTRPVLVVNTETTPVPVTVSAADVVRTQTAVPPGAFSVVLNGPGVVSGPDPEGTNYAITSVTVANTSDPQSVANIGANWGTTSDCTSFSSDTTNAAGPRIVVPGGETVHLAFPQPFVLSARPGAASCLRISLGGAGTTFTVVGYRF